MKLYDCIFIIHKKTQQELNRVDLPTTTNLKLDLDTTFNELP